MKLVILKLLSLLVFLLGAVSLILAMGLQEVQVYFQQVPVLLEQARAALPDQFSFLEDLLTVKGLWFTGSIVAIVCGIYGITPRMKKTPRPKKIKYDGPHGEVQIQLDTVEQSLKQVLIRMPEIKRIDIKVDPHDGGRRALIRADVVLNQQPGQNARALASLVSDYISETATKLLGLEDLATIEMKVVGIVVNSKKSSRAIRKESLSHSTNASVELLEAAPAPLTLTGPREPLASTVLDEDDYDGGEHDAVETGAVDVRHEASTQAAARSELLEPLAVGHPISTAPSDDDVAATRPLATSAPAAVAPLAMDVLDEPLHGGDTGFDEEDAEDDEPVYRSGSVLDGVDDAEDEGALDDDPAYGGQVAEVGETPVPEQAPFADPVVDEQTVEVQTAEVVETHQPEEAEDVTIPEQESEAGGATDEEKKKWGWFN